MRIVILGLSITSSWGNGHATIFRALVRQLTARGHSVTFLERDVRWYAQHRDMPSPPGATTRLYGSLEELTTRHEPEIRAADGVIVGSYVPDGIAVGEWVMATTAGVTAFYDIDTPVTLTALAGGDAAYVSRALIPRYDVYLSFTGGPTLTRLEREFGARRARPLYCCVDSQHYFPEAASARWDLGYLGTYSADRQPSLTELMLQPAARLPDCRFVVAGPLFPESIVWPVNVERVAHLPPSEHRAFYNAQRFTLNITRADMIRAGWSASVRLFEAAACGVPIITDYWEGLEHFFEPGREILVARSGADAEACLRTLSEEERHAIGLRARARVLAHHTAAHRAGQLESFLLEAARARSS